MARAMAVLFLVLLGALSVQTKRLASNVTETPAVEEEPEKCSKLGRDYHVYCTKKCVKQFSCGKCAKGQVIDDFLTDDKVYALPDYSNDIKGGCKGVACVPLYWNVSMKSTKAGSVHLFIEEKTDTLVVTFKMLCPFLMVPDLNKSDVNPWVAIGIKDGKDLPSSSPVDWQYKDFLAPGYYAGASFEIPLKRACAWGAAYKAKHHKCSKTIDLTRSKFLSLAVYVNVGPYKFQHKKPISMWDTTQGATFHSKAQFCETSPFYKLKPFTEDNWAGQVTMVLPSHAAKGL